MTFFNMIFSHLASGDLNLFCALVGILRATSLHIRAKIQLLGILCFSQSLISDLPTRNIIWYYFLSSGLFSGNVWRNLSSWMPQRDSSAQVLCDSPFRDLLICSRLFYTWLFLAWCYFNYSLFLVPYFCIFCKSQL